MLMIKKDFDDPPEILKSKRCIKRADTALYEKKSHRISYYYHHPEVKKALYKIYKNKCAYCETNISAGAVLQIDHYRPFIKVLLKKLIIQGIIGWYMNGVILFPYVQLVIEKNQTIFQLVKMAKENLKQVCPKMNGKQIIKFY